MAKVTGPELQQVLLGRRLLADGSGRSLRILAGLSQATVANRIPCSQTALAKWEAGQRSPRPEAAARYARVAAELAEALRCVEAARGSAEVGP